MPTSQERETTAFFLAYQQTINSEMQFIDSFTATLFNAKGVSRAKPVNRPRPMSQSENEGRRQHSAVDADSLPP